MNHEVETIPNPLPECYALLAHRALEGAYVLEGPWDDPAFNQAHHALRKALWDYICMFPEEERERARLAHNARPLLPPWDTVEVRIERALGDHPGRYRL